MSSSGTWKATTAPNRGTSCQMKFQPSGPTPQKNAGLAPCGPPFQIPIPTVLGSDKEMPKQQQKEGLQTGSRQAFEHPKWSSVSIGQASLDQFWNLFGSQCDPKGAKGCILLDLPHSDTFVVFACPGHGNVKQTRLGRILEALGTISGHLGVF